MGIQMTAAGESVAEVGGRAGGQSSCGARMQDLNLQEATPNMYTEALSLCHHCNLQGGWLEGSQASSREQVSERGVRSHTQYSHTDNGKQEMEPSGMAVAVVMTRTGHSTLQLIIHTCKRVTRHTVRALLTSTSCALKT